MKKSPSLARSISVSEMKSPVVSLKTVMSFPLTEKVDFLVLGISYAVRMRSWPEAESTILLTSTKWFIRLCLLV